MIAQMSRRDLMKCAGFGALSLALGGAWGRSALALGPDTEMIMAPPQSPYELPKLPYAYDALAPVLSAEIVKIHYEKHHAGYVKGLNATLNKLEAARASREAGSAPEQRIKGVRNELRKMRRTENV